MKDEELNTILRKLVSLATRETTRKGTASKGTRKGSKAATARPGTRKGPKKPPTKEATSAGRRINPLDTAAQVLGDAFQPMNCGEMIEEVLKRRLWTPQGTTPAAAPSSAIHGDMKKHGTHSRFFKAGRGRFRLSRTG